MLVKLQHNHLHIYEEWQSFISVFISILQEQISGMVKYDRNNGCSNRMNKFCKENFRKTREDNVVHFSFILTPD